MSMAGGDLVPPVSLKTTGDVDWHSWRPPPSPIGEATLASDVASAKIFISFIVQPLLRLHVLQTPSSLNLSSSPQSAQRSGIVWVAVRQRLACPPCCASSFFSLRG